MAASTLLTSTVTGGINGHATTAEEANALATDFVSNGVVGAITLNSGSGGTGSFCVNADASPDMGVTIKAGQAYITATPSGQNSQVLRVRAAADYTAYTINANASGSTKYDWIYLSISATNANAPSSDGSNVASFVTSRSSSNSTDNGTPPTYGLLLAIVTVANGASSITNSNITDKRFNASNGAQNGSLVVQQNGTGTDAIIQAAGIDTNVNLKLQPKGTGVVEVGENSSSAAQISAIGSDTNIDLRLAPKGTGNVKRGTTGGAIDWWEEVGRTTLGVAGDTITVSSFSGRKYLKVICNLIATGGTLSVTMTFNSDTSTNYATRASSNGGADATAASATGANLAPSTAGQNYYISADIVNVTAQEKSIWAQTFTTGAAGGTNLPERRETVTKWANTAAQITTIAVTNGGTGDYAIGSEVIVLGHD